MMGARKRDRANRGGGCTTALGEPARHSVMFNESRDGLPWQLVDDATSTLNAIAPTGSETMSQPKSFTIGRRTVLKAAAAARAADVVKLGLDNPLTGTYAAVGKNELIGCQLAIEQINKKGGILHRKAELLIEDSTSGDAGTAVQKARKLIDRDKVNFLIGNVNSALALAMASVASEKGVFMMDPGGHTDAITGTSCHWNVVRICNTTQSEANAVAGTLVKAYGKKFYS